MAKNAEWQRAPFGMPDEKDRKELARLIRKHGRDVIVIAAQEMPLPPSHRPLRDGLLSRPRDEIERHGDELAANLKAIAEKYRAQRVRNWKHAAGVDLFQRLWGSDSRQRNQLSFLAYLKRNKGRPARRDIERSLELKKRQG